MLKEVKITPNHIKIVLIQWLFGHGSWWCQMLGVRLHWRGWHETALPSTAAQPAQSSAAQPALMEPQALPLGTADTASSNAALPTPPRSQMGDIHRCDVNWLTDPRLVRARIRWEKDLRNIAGLSEHIHDLEALWKNCSLMSEKHTLLARMTGLIQ